MFRDALRRVAWLAAGSCGGLLMMATAGCALTTEHHGTSPAVQATAGVLVGQDRDLFAHPGTVWFWYHDPALSNAVRVACSVPRDPQTARVLIVMPGAQRNASDYLDDWLGTSIARSTIVLVPELPRDQFSEDTYNLGGVVDENGDDTDPSTWTYGFIERLFAKVVESSGSDAATYDLFGHSAGAQ